MQAETIAEVLLEGRRFMVFESEALGLFERNRTALIQRRLEPAQLELAEPAGAVLHLLLGAAPLSVLVPRSDDPRAAARDEDADAGGSAAGVFVDFGAYLTDADGRDQSSYARAT